MEAIERFFEVPGKSIYSLPPAVELNPAKLEITNPMLVVIVGCFGLASNILGLFLFHGTYPMLFTELPIYTSSRTRP